MHVLKKRARLYKKAKMACGTDSNNSKGNVSVNSGKLTSTMLTKSSTMVWLNTTQNHSGTKSFFTLITQ